MAAPTVYQKQTDASLVLLFPYREHFGAGATGPLQISYVGDPNLPQTPLAAALTGSMVTRTSAQLNWAAPDNTGRPPITAVRVWRSQDGLPSTLIATLAAGALSYPDSGLAVNTPEIVWTYTVQYVNSDGPGDLSNPVGLQWQGFVTNPPAPTLTLDRTGLTPTQVTLVWTEPAEAPGTVIEHGVFEGTTLVKAGIDPLATSYVWTGLSPGSRHANVSVRRRNSSLSGNPPGWSTTGPTITFTTPVIQVVHEVATGVPVGNDEYQQGRVEFTQWAASRTYSMAAAVSDFNDSGATTLGVTFGPQDPAAATATGGAQAATALQNALEDFYYPNGVLSTARQNIKYHFATDNETDRNHTSGNLPTNYIDTVRLCRDVVHRLVGGTRRYPNAYMAVDMTQNNINNFGSGPRFKAIAQYLDVFACSMYPPGRDIAKNPATNFNAYSSYCQAVFDALADWRATGGPGFTYATPNAGTSLVGQLDRFATWEFGIPIDHAQNPAGMTSPNEGEPTAQTNFSRRPRYLAGGLDNAGSTSTPPGPTNWKGFLQYIVDTCDAMGVIACEQIYWNQQSDADKPNPLWHDQHDMPWSGGQTRANPDSETAWHDWVIGSRLPNA